MDHFEWKKNSEGADGGKLNEGIISFWFFLGSILWRCDAISFSSGTSAEEEEGKRHLSPSSLGCSGHSGREWGHLSLMILTFSLKRSLPQSNKQATWHKADREGGSQVMSVKCGADDAWGGVTLGTLLPTLSLSSRDCLSFLFFLLSSCVQLCLGALVTVVPRTGAHGLAKWGENAGLPTLSLQPAGDNAPPLPGI